MTGEERGLLHRRLIRSALIRDHGWHVVSRVDGYVDVREPGRRSDGSDLLARVRDAVAALGYAPTASYYRDGDGVQWVRVSTPETTAQAGRGEHSS